MRKNPFNEASRFPPISSTIGRLDKKAGTLIQTQKIKNAAQAAAKTGTFTKPATATAKIISRPSFAKRAFGVLRKLGRFAK